MLSFVLAPENMPFAVALLLMVMIGAVEAIGLGLGAVELEVGADASHGGDFLGWLGFGTVPLLVMIVVFLALFGMVGIAVQQLAAGLLGSALSPWVAAPAAAVATLPLLGWSSRGVARILPRDETTAVGRDTLIGKRATITVGTARVGSPARASVRDHFNQVHHVMVEPTLEHTDVPEGQSLLLVRREGDIFIGMAEGETLSLSLDDRPGLFT